MITYSLLTPSYANGNVSSPSSSLSSPSPLSSSSPSLPSKRISLSVSNDRVVGRPESPLSLESLRKSAEFISSSINTKNQNHSDKDIHSPFIHPPSPSPQSPSEVPPTSPSSSSLLSHSAPIYTENPSHLYEWKLISLPPSSSLSSFSSPSPSYQFTKESADREGITVYHLNTFRKINDNEKNEKQKQRESQQIIPQRKFSTTKIISPSSSSSSSSSSPQSSASPSPRSLSRPSSPSLSPSPFPYTSLLSENRKRERPSPDDQNNGNSSLSPIPTTISSSSPLHLLSSSTIYFIPSNIINFTTQFPSLPISFDLQRLHSLHSLYSFISHHDGFSSNYYRYEFLYNFIREEYNIVPKSIEPGKEEKDKDHHDKDQPSSPLSPSFSSNSSSLPSDSSSDQDIGPLIFDMLNIILHVELTKGLSLPFMLSEWKSVGNANMNMSMGMSMGEESKEMSSSPDHINDDSSLPLPLVFQSYPSVSHLLQSTRSAYQEGIHRIVSRYSQFCKERKDVVSFVLKCYRNAIPYKKVMTLISEKYLSSCSPSPSPSSFITFSSLSSLFELSFQDHLFQFVYKDPLVSSFPPSLSYRLSFWLSYQKDIESYGRYVEIHSSLSDEILKMMRKNNDKSVGKSLYGGRGRMGIARNKSAHGKGKGKVPTKAKGIGGKKWIEDDEEDDDMMMEDEEENDSMQEEEEDDDDDDDDDDNDGEGAGGVGQKSYITFTYEHDENDNSQISQIEDKDNESNNSLLSPSSTGSSSSISIFSSSFLPTPLSRASSTLSNSSSSSSSTSSSFPSLFSMSLFTLRISSSFGSTTGCSLWPAGIAFAEFALQNPHLFRGKRLLELGGGVGFTSIVLSSPLISPKFIVSTDCDKKSRDYLSFNAKINGIDVIHPFDGGISATDNMGIMSFNGGGMGRNAMLRMVMGMGMAMGMGYGNHIQKYSTIHEAAILSPLLPSPQPPSPSPPSFSSIPSSSFPNISSSPSPSLTPPPSVGLLSAPFDWLHPSSSDLHSFSPDIIFSTDTIYLPETHRALAGIVKESLALKKGNVAYFCQVERDPVVFKHYLDTFLSLGLSMVEMDIRTVKQKFLYERENCKLHKWELKEK